MTTSSTDFKDIENLRFTVPDRRMPFNLIGTLIFERGTRSYSIRLFQAGWRTYADLEGRTVSELLKKVPTTRPNFNKVLSYLQDVGVRIG